MDLHVSLVGRRNIAAELYRQLREAIVEGRLRPGDPVPPTRELARRLRLSRTTVTAAYTRLSAEGLLSARVGAGTFVSHLAERLQNGAPRGRAPGAGGNAPPALRPQPVWNTLTVPAPFADPADFDFRPGLTDASLFPHERWRRTEARALRSDPVACGVYGDPGGLPALREAIVHHVGIARAVSAAADDVIVTTGTQQALDLIARVLAAPGDAVAMENPGYTPAAWLFSSLGLDVHGVRVDAEGIVVSEIPADVQFVYVTPSHQYPLGVAMSLERRRELLAWADRHDVAIIEDDYDSEFRYGTRPIEPIHTMDSAGRIIYVGSFSKTLLPTLRLGFLITPPGIRDALLRAKFVSDWHTSLLGQATLAEFIAGGSFATHIRRMQRVYEERRELIRDAITRDFAGLLTLVPSHAGLHLAATADHANGPETVAVMQRALEDSVAVQDLSRYGIGAPAPAGLMFGYGAIPSERIAEGLERLRRSFTPAAAGTAPSAHRGRRRRTPAFAR